MADVDLAKLQAQAGITGAESEETLRGRAAERVLAEPIVRQTFADLGAYYATKQLQAGDDAGEVMRWQYLRVALQDVETAFRGHVATGEAAVKRTTRLQDMIARAREPLRRMARFRAD